MKRFRIVLVPLALLFLPDLTGPLLAQDPASMFEKRTYKNAAGKVLPYRLLQPENYDPEKKYPLVVFLHGAGERGGDNELQMIHGVKTFAEAPYRKKYPCFVIAPQCSNKDRWVEVDWNADTHTTPKRPSEPMGLLLELIPALQKEFSIDPKRLYVSGLSMGGYGTWDLIIRKPDWFAAAAPVCGGGDETQAEKIAKVPVWVFHGAQDGAVKVARSRNMVAALEKAGGKPKYKEYPDVGHDSWNPTYKDPEFYAWLFAQKRE
jgi:predicted peptidase